MVREFSYILPVFVFPLCLAQGIAGAAENDADKSAFNLFNPVPRQLMRELAPDRPDATENPHTVDAGHFQLEMDFANFTYNQAGNETLHAWNFAPLNFKVGLLNNVDLQFVYDNFLHVHTRDRATGAASQSGFGDFTTRLKINLWGNDEGRTALALLPYVKFPTSTSHLGNDAVEGGIILPLAVELPGDFELGTEGAVGIFQDQNGNGRHAEFIGSITVDHAIIGKLSGYLEFFSSFSTETHSQWIGTADVGLEYLLTKDVQLDCGCNIGLTPAADTAHAFTGITIRF